jgi:hypothetical protein
MDGSSWITLDEQKNNSTTNSAHPIGTFAVSHSEECRFVRLRQTGKNAAGKDHLTIFAFEIFGGLFGIGRATKQYVLTWLSSWRKRTLNPCKCHGRLVIDSAGTPRSVAMVIHTAVQY